MILAGDIGGTNTRLALFDERNEPHDIHEFPSQKYPGLEPIIEEYLRSVGAAGTRFASASFGVAGPVEQGADGAWVKGTNLSWAVRQATLGRSLQLEPARVGLLNDLSANALGATAVSPEQTVVLHAGEEVAGHRAIISAGTGLGVGGLYWDGKEFHAMPSEGGHCNFGPRDDREEQLLRYLRERDRADFHGHVSWEHVLSGAGLYNLFDFLRCHGGPKPTAAVPEAIPDRPGRGTAAKTISKAGLDGSCPCSVAAVDWFVSLYGAAAGNVAISFLALGGLYIGGGIAPKLISKIKGPGFMNAFFDKGPLKTQVLERINVRVVLDEYAALRGAARYAARLAG